MIDEEQYQVFNATAAVILPTLHNLKELTENIFDVKNGKNQYCFFTVNFKPEYDSKIEEISDMMKEWTNKCIYLKDNYLYSIEQRSETSDSITGIHIHILFKKNDKPPTKIKRAFVQKFFDKYVGTHASLDFKFICDSLPKIKYILGVKEKKKMPKVYMDRVFKDSYQLPYWDNIGYDEEIKNITDSSEYKELFSHVI